TYLLRHSIRAGNHRTKSIKKVFTDLAQGLAQDRFDQVQTSPDGDRTIAVSRRMMSGGGSVVILEDVTESKRAQERITHLAKYDDLTGLANRNQFRERINGMLAAMHKRKNHVAIHLIDLDRFKTINDTLGHPIGDKLLKEVASRLKTVIRPGDMITRFGGDEFVVLQIGTERYQDAKWLAERLARTLKDPFDIDGHRIDIGASIGIAMAPMDGVDADQLLKKADMALYAAKNGGGGAGTPRSGAGFARGSHFRAIRSLLSAAGRPAQRPRNNLRSIAALAAPEARNGAAVDLHSHRRRDRPDHPPRRMGVAACLLRSGEVAEKRQ